MNNELIKKTVKSIKITIIVHILIHILLAISHILFFKKTYFITKMEYYIFFIEIFIISFSLLLPIITYIFICRLKFTEKLFFNLKNILYVFSLIFFINGFIIAVYFLENTKIISVFYQYCPFNFNINDIPKIFDNFQINEKKRIKKICNYNRCFPFDNNVKGNKTNYICNMVCDKFVGKCSTLTLNNQNININLLKYIDYCKDYTHIYKCEEVDYIALYSISYDYKCPNKFDINFSTIFTNIIMFLDPIIFSIPLILETQTIDELFNILYGPSNNTNNNLDETSHTSKIDENSNNINSDNFEKKSTITIIIDNKIKTNMNHIDILNINKTRNILSRKEIKQNSMEEEKSKTENNLIINNNNNIFKIFNHKIN